MAHPGHLQRLAERIHRILAQGIQLDAGARRYIESTLPDPSPAGVEAIMGTDLAGEWAPLADLIFFPDEAFQAQIEDDLLEDLPEGADIAGRLGDRRRACQAALQRMDQIETLRNEAPMEALILGRLAAPYVDPADIYRQVAMIDTLCELTGCAKNRFQPASRQGW